MDTIFKNDFGLYLPNKTKHRIDVSDQLSSYYIPQKKFLYGTKMLLWNYYLG